MFINLSNHPSASWKAEQIAAAVCYGQIIDIIFPSIPANWDTKQVKKLAEKYSQDCMKRINASTDPLNAIHLAGEPVFCYHVAQRLILSGYTVLTSATQRNTKEENGTKVSVFQFERYRKYDETCNNTTLRSNKERTLSWMKYLYIELKNEYIKIGSNNKSRLLALKWLFLLEFTLLYFINNTINFIHSMQNLEFWEFSPLPMLEYINQYIRRERIPSSALAILCLIMAILSFIKIHRMKLQNDADKKQENKLNSLTHIAVKLLANAIRPRMINMLFLFVFLVHISCIGNAVFSLLTTNSFYEFIQYAFVLIVLICSILYIILIFPIVPPSPECLQSVFYSGISSPISFNPDRQSNKIEIDRNNLLPLVRAFYIKNRKHTIQIKEGDIIYILLSNQLTVSKLKEQLNSLEKASFNSTRPDKTIYLEELRTNLQHAITDNEQLEDILEAIIKAFAFFEFRDNAEICNALEKVKVKFSQPIDCDDFDSCFVEAKNTMQNYANQNYEIIINSSPATKVITSVLTLLSIQNDRYLLYFKQFSQIDIKDKMCLTVKNDKSVKELIEELADELSQDKV
ncbi:hypothetical protein [Bacteroides sp.]